ncbi:hypothetical protein P4W15_05085 [Morganella morganii]|nr:hypothetical protein [Morganella morganii]
MITGKKGGTAPQMAYRGCAPGGGADIGDDPFAGGYPGEDTE